MLLARALGHGAQLEKLIQQALGVALILAATGLFVRAYLRLAERAGQRDGTRPADPLGPPAIVVRPLPTMLVGAVGGLVVGMTSVGSGSLIIIALMLLYPALRASVLLASALKLLGVSSPATAVALMALLLLAPPTWMLLRRRHGFPALPRRERAQLPLTAG